MIKSSVLDFDWMNEIKKGEHHLFIAEGLLMYLEPDETKQLLLQLNKHFQNKTWIFELISPFLANKTKWLKDMRKTSATFKWGISDVTVLQEWGLHYSSVKEFYYAEEETHSLPFIYKPILWFVILRKMIRIAMIEF